ncbi:MAG TPA: WD40 repeat domain-containing serine/threonine protein kinase, partial [Kofleriaceae bacterium]|nr:WD40 repeat domain-containing serine/threonine protein kinase [Kofleriaceae bacterium]
MKFDGNDTAPATEATPPSPADPTRTSQPDPSSPASFAGKSPEVTPQVSNPERYHILGEHGRGGLGRVSRAHDHQLGRDIAIKELISRGHISEVRFLREALITARLEHPGIVPVYEAGRWPDGTPFYAMKLVAGRSLRELIAERTTVDERIRLLHHVIAVADALAYAHGRNIIHRDLKPANIIVGDFGETIVIDWGLAKDLTAAEEPTVGGGPFRVNRDDGLTSAGSVLGTPAYMAPEQERGEPVDQRADVFAIGAMLWELCSLQKLPPSFAGQRHRILRRAGIDQDLVTIIDKALDPDPARRYPDAGALAADLKAFKAGARIAARRYSLWALLSHWTRRHRALSLTLTAAIALSITATIVYLRRIAEERDRADIALERAETAKNDLILEHAALLLRSDPTAALTTLAAYHGGDSTRRSELLAEARGRGVARKILRPHNDTIWFLAGQRDGAFISVGEDHRVQRTFDGVTTSLASNVSYTVRCAFAPTQNLLAYSKSPSGIALMDLSNFTSTSLDVTSPVALVFTPDGTRLAALDNRGSVVVWDVVTAPIVVYRGSFPDATSITFPHPATLLLFGRSQLSSLDLRSATPSIYKNSIEVLDANERYLALGLSNGMLTILSKVLKPLATAQACKQHLL